MRPAPRPALMRAMMSGVINCSSFIQELVATRTNSTPSGTASRVDARHDVRRHSLQLIHPGARRDADEQYSVGRDALRGRHRRDLRPDETRPLGNDLRLADPARQSGALQVPCERFGDGYGTALVGAIGTVIHRRVK